jgi:hypothetical protein
VLARKPPAGWDDGFQGFNDGYRPGHSQDGALDAQAGGINQRKVGRAADAGNVVFLDAPSND